MTEPSDSVTLPAGSTSSTVVVSEPVRFVPDARALRLLDAYLEAIGEGGRITNVVLAAKMRPPMKPDALQKWRTRNPQVDVWLRERIDATLAPDKPLVLRRLLELALRGSAEHAKLLGQFMGWFAPADRGGDPSLSAATAAVQINFYGLPEAPE